MKYIVNIRLLMVLSGFVFLIGCADLPEAVDFSKPVKIKRLSEQAWVVDIGKALDRPSRYKLSRVEAAKAAQKINCGYFKSDSLLNQQLDPYKGQIAYRCATQDEDNVLVTEELLLMEDL